MANYLKVLDSALDVSAVSALVTAPNTGATSIFVGTTRDNFCGKRVVRLEYEAYVPMALKVNMSKIQNSHIPYRYLGGKYRYFTW
jgi:molybdopterin synthase catalytic subunit